MQPGLETCQPAPSTQVLKQQVLCSWQISYYKLDQCRRIGTANQQGSPASAPQHYKWASPDEPMRVAHTAAPPALPCPLITTCHGWICSWGSSLLRKQASADATAETSKSRAFRSRAQRYSSVGNARKTAHQGPEMSLTIQAANKHLCFGSCPPLSPLTFRHRLWRTGSEQSFLRNSPWAELQHRFTHSPFLLPGDSHTHSCTRLPMQATSVLSATEIT